MNGLPVFGSGLWIDQVKDKGRIVHQVVDQTTAVAFENDGQLLAWELGQEAVAPLAEGLWGLINLAFVDGAGAGPLQVDGVFGIGPIDGDKCRKLGLVGVGSSGWSRGSRGRRCRCVHGVKFFTGRRGWVGYA